MAPPSIPVLLGIVVAATTVARVVCLPPPLHALGRLFLEDGSVHVGTSFGAELGGSAVDGEVVFTTGMTGFPESLSDPSYHGQILVMTYPLQGNYGLPDWNRTAGALPAHLESGRVHVKALVVSEYAGSQVHHWEAASTLSHWLRHWGVPALAGIDTRGLVHRLRDRGTMRGLIVRGGSGADAAAVTLPRPSPVGTVAGAAGGDEAGHLVREVAALPHRGWGGLSPAGVFAPIGSEGGPLRVLVVDCGAKLSIVRTLLQRGLTTQVVPWDADLAGIIASGASNRTSSPAIHGIVVSNGPGDPARASATVIALRQAMESFPDMPILAICLGHQLLALAAGMSTYKLPFGNRGHNHPVQDLVTGRAYITSQNHGYAVAVESGEPGSDDAGVGLLPAGWRPAFQNLNDGSNEGVAHQHSPWLGIQWHPEAAGGPLDTSFLLSDFADKVSSHRETGSAPPWFPGSSGETPRLELEGRGDDSRSSGTSSRGGQATSRPPRPPSRPYRVLVLGSGGIAIGQAGEFDYAGTQALKALKALGGHDGPRGRFEGGLYTILVNPNVASVQTTEGAFQRRAPRDGDDGRAGDTALADEVFSTPVTPRDVARVISATQPDGILLSFGGQTALNCGVELQRSGVLAAHNVEVLGTPIPSIVATEDRAQFKARLAEIDQRVAASESVSTVDQAVAAAQRIGYPVLLRGGFALGGSGSGVASSDADTRRIAMPLLRAGPGQGPPPAVLIDRYLAGWREVEYEVVRDGQGNRFCVCNMENLDPLGVHTGESIVVAPSQTLTDVEYFRLRDAALRIADHFDIVGECNVQFALDPRSADFLVVEVNPRLSRSSALASKATGYPIAAVAAQLALGIPLPELRNAVTGGRTAAFHEPALDYVVVKVPRWDLSKFAGVDRRIGTQMKSIGEAMGVARSFPEALNKALRMAGGSSLLGDMGQQHHARDHDHDHAADATGDAALLLHLAVAREGRLHDVARAMYHDRATVQAMHDATGIDGWFLSQIRSCLTAHKELGRMLAAFHRHATGGMTTVGGRASGEEEGGTIVPAADRQFWGWVGAGERPEAAPSAGGPPSAAGTSILAALWAAKRCGYTDDDIAAVHPSPDVDESEVRRYRQVRGVVPVFKQIDSVAAEYLASTNYLYATYHGEEDDNVTVSAGEQKAAAGREARREASGTSTDTSTGSTVLVLGSGVYRIGSSVEFDSTSMSAMRTLRAQGLRAVMMNCNPETVSTDWDESDELYLDELSLERILDVVDRLEEPDAARRRAGTTHVTTVAAAAAATGGGATGGGATGGGTGSGGTPLRKLHTLRGVVVSMGGQTPNNVALPLRSSGIPILGTPPESIARAENRAAHSAMLEALDLSQPPWVAAQSNEGAVAFARQVGFPVLVRPSFVLSGTAMRVAFTAAGLRTDLATATRASPNFPVVLSRYIEDAREIDIDAVALHGELVAYAISDHVERGGVHSGDATLVLPPSITPQHVHVRLKRLAQQISRELRISGPFNVQALWRPAATMPATAGGAGLGLGAEGRGAGC